MRRLAPLVLAAFATLLVPGGASAATQFLHESTLPHYKSDDFFKGTVRVRIGLGVRNDRGIIIGSTRWKAERTLDLRCAAGDETGDGGPYINSDDAGIAIVGKAVYATSITLVDGPVELPRPGTLCEQARAQRDATHDTNVFYSPDLGKTWTVLPKPQALPLVESIPSETASETQLGGEARLLLATADGKGALYGNPVKGYSRYDLATGVWIPAGMGGFMPGLAFRRAPSGFVGGGYEWGTSAKPPKGYSRAGARQVGKNRVWEWWASKSGKAILALGKRHTKPKLNVSVKRIGKSSSCVPRTLSLRTRFTQVAAGDTGKVVWAVTARKLSHRCGGKTRSVHVRARLAKSRNYGHSWKRVAGPPKVPGDSLTILDVDRSTPLIADEDNVGKKRCKDGSLTPVWRLKGKHWSYLGCHDIGSGE